MPPGQWSLTLALLCSREALDHDFRLEVATDRPLASAIVHPAREGPFEAGLAFAIDDSSDDPVVIRLSTQRAAFDGMLTLVEASLRRRATATSARTAPVLEGQSL